MSFTVALFDPMLSAGSAEAVSMSLHSSLPDSAGSNELSGSGYARQSVTWAPASGGSVQTASAVTFNVPAGTVSHVGLWNSGGVWLGSAPLDTPEEFAAAGTFTVDLVTLSVENA